MTDLDPLVSAGDQVRIVRAFVERYALEAARGLVPGRRKQRQPKRRVSGTARDVTIERCRQIDSQALAKPLPQEVA